MANSNMANNGTFELDSGWHYRTNADYATQNKRSGTRCMKADVLMVRAQVLRKIFM